MPTSTRRARRAPATSASQARPPRPPLAATVEYIAGRPMPGALRQLVEALDHLDRAHTSGRAD